MDSSSSQNYRDGQIDFSHYSTAQLTDLQHSIDQSSHPLNYQNLIAELESRKQGSAKDNYIIANRWQANFTHKIGLFGWLESLRKWQSVYGDGWVEIGIDEVLIHGWQRTWLGIPSQATVTIPFANIRNVGLDGSLINFEYGRLHRHITFRAHSSDDATEIVGHLPIKKTARFEQKWSQLRNFQRTLDAVAPHAWITVAIILANIFIFVAMAITEKRTSQFDLQQLLDWGANYGPMTVNGQWWRLASALFIHLEPTHLIINMWAFWNVGKLTERLYGRWVFLGLFVSSGLFASLSTILWDPTRVSAGASGAIFGIFGAFLAYLAQRRTRVPASVIRAHWASTLAFVLFSLVSGALQTGIDNAAHIGGVISGFIFGWIVAEPLVPRRRLKPQQVMASIIILIAAGTIGFFQVRGTGSQLTTVEQYWQVHDWYRRGEAENLRQWQTLAARAAAGTISNLEMGYQFETNILPFWNMAEERLQKDDAALSGEQAQFAELLMSYVQTRREWASGIISYNKERNGKNLTDLQELAHKIDMITARFQRITWRASMSHRPRALSNNTVVTYLRNHILTGSLCIRGPEYFGKHVAESDLKTDGPAMRDAIGCKAQRAFDTDDFSTLETMFNDYGKTFGELPDGSSRLAGLADGLSDLFEYGARNVLDDLGRTADWRRAYPNSIAPDLIDAIIFHSWAWAARGGGTVDTITQQMMAYYNFRTEMAAAALEEMKSRADASPLWYQLSLDIGVDQSISLEKMRAIFDEGEQKFPYYWPLYGRMIRALLPRWFGSTHQVDHFISEMDDKFSDPIGTQIYARLYWTYDKMEEDSTNIFDESDVIWKLVKIGFQDMIKVYPKSDYILNGFANMACQADAASDYVELRSLIDKRVSATAWSDRVSIQSCDDKFKDALSLAHMH